MNTTEPMAAIRNYINAFNKGDGDGMAAMFAVPGSILDGMAPHLWLGPTSRSGLVSRRADSKVSSTTLQAIT